MRLNTFLRFLGVALVFLVVPVFSVAQQFITFEASKNNRKYCESYEPGQVRLDRQISCSSGIQGQTWGVDRQGLWVERGCRAIFIIPAYGGPGGPGGDWWDPEPSAAWPPHGGQ
jgi:hypothetical protein